MVKLENVKEYVKFIEDLTQKGDYNAFEVALLIAERSNIEHEKITEELVDSVSKLVDRVSTVFDGYINEEMENIVDNKREIISKEENEMSTKYSEYLKEKIKEDCNEYGCLEMYWDYRDKVPESMIKNYILELLSGKDIEDLNLYLINTLSEINIEYADEVEDNFIKQLYTEAPTDEIKKEIKEKGFLMVMDDLYSLGYNGIDWNIKDLIKNTSVKVNIYFATDAEQNYDMSSIVTAFGNDYKNPSFADGTDCFDNALTYLIHQQGHYLKEVFNELISNKRTDNSFIAGVCNDICNNSSEAMSELGVYVELRGQDIVDFCAAIQEGNGYLVINKETNIGLFNQWSGTCGFPDAYLEKDFVVPVNMIRNIQIEGAKNDYEYTINEVCGMVGSFWKSDALKYTNVTPELTNENFTEVHDEIQQMLDLKETKAQEEEEPDICE